MTEDLPEHLPSIDPTILTDVVRQDQRSPHFDLSSWSVQRLSDRGVVNPGGLWLVSGEGSDHSGFRAWSVVLKILQRPAYELPPSDLWSWKREFLLAQSGLLERLPGPVKAPHFYHAEETANGAWLWQEHIKQGRPTTEWGLAEYAFAAYQLGCWNGACVTSLALPTEPWLARQHYHSWYSSANPDQDFQFSLNQQYIVGEMRKRYDQLWIERERFYRVLEALPQTFSHFDSQSRNLLVRQRTDAQDELVLVDWAWCGLGPLGAELYALVTMSATLLDWPPSAVAQLDTAVFGQYLHGLRAAGWLGDADSVRLGYVTWVAVWLGVVFPNIVALWCTPEYHSAALGFVGAAEDDLYRQWLPLLSYALDCADEARLLMYKLDLS